MRNSFSLTLLTTAMLAGCAQPVQPAEPPAQPAVASSSSSSSSSSTAAVAVPLPFEPALEQLPSELSILHFGAMELRGIDFTLGKPVSRTDAYARYNISYRSNGLRITGILNIPSGGETYPLLVFNHGYIDPVVYTQGRGLRREQDYMAREGFAVLHIDYRGHAGSDESPMTSKVYDGNLEYAMDSANAIAAIRAANIDHIDTSQVGMLGHSMGGGVTLALLTGRPELVDAAVLYAPVHADVWENFTRWRAEREEGDRTLTAFKTKEENPDFWNALSPETYLSDIEAPVLLFHGSNDNDVPKDWSDHLNARLTELGKDVEYVEYEDEGHEFASKWTDFMKKSAEFFHENLDEK